jgi:hypothetical protein
LGIGRPIPCALQPQPPQPVDRLPDPTHRHHSSPATATVAAHLGLRNKRADELEQRCGWIKAGVVADRWARLSDPALVGDRISDPLGGASNEAMHKAMEGAEMADGYKYCDYENNTYRRKENGRSHSIDDVLSGGKKWVPYKGSDALAPGMWGDEIDDPLGDDGGGEMAKADAPDVIP